MKGLSNVCVLLFLNYVHNLCLLQPFRKTKPGQHGLSYLGPSIWNGLDSDCNSKLRLNAFKHALKKRFFDLLRNREDDIYDDIYYIYIITNINFIEYSNNYVYIYNKDIYILIIYTYIYIYIHIYIYIYIYIYTYMYICTILFLVSSCHVYL